MKPPHKTNSSPIVQNHPLEWTLTSNQPTMALLIDDIVRYPEIVNQYSGGIISDTKHMLVSGSDTFVPECQFKGSW
ncbi:S ribonuclease [Pyrus ussuriensis x Pyrus communis]|uniref:S ribonuclease n=1 Tax=Pyrus ussuriensis x Pyrus communis TaxID=2448454 RepID=A0A5N5GN29_9ROSA|nr:S ribonuclease [Pyrus ussuriensis x Pyrus communis]